MKISIIAKPKKKKEFVKKTGEKEYTVSVKEEAKEGRANRAVIQALTEYFGISKSQISIVSGFTSKQKVVEISVNEDELQAIENSKEPQAKLF